jgi:hypothetical protein
VAEDLEEDSEEEDSEVEALEELLPVLEEEE